MQLSLTGRYYWQQGKTGFETESCCRRRFPLSVLHNLHFKEEYGDVVDIKLNSLAHNEKLAVPSVHVLGTVVECGATSEQQSVLPGTDWALGLGTPRVSTTCWKRWAGLRWSNDDRLVGCWCFTKSKMALHIAPPWKPNWSPPISITSTTHPWQTAHSADHQNPV